MVIIPDRSKVVIRHILERHALERPTKECAVFENGEKWTYGDALLEAYRAANALAEVGIKRGENVMIFLRDIQDWIRAWWGVASIGAVMVPINNAYKGEILRHVCMDSGARHIITTPEQAERIKALGLDLNIIDKSILTESSTDEPGLDKPMEPWDICMICYTSGTTGPSKGVIIPHLKLYYGGRVWREKGTSDDTFLSIFPLYHVAGVETPLNFYSMGARLVYRSVFSANRFWDEIRKHGVTIALAVGTIGEYLAATPPQPNDADNPVRLMLVTPMVRDPTGFAERFGIEELITSYSMTEIYAPLTSQWPISKPKSCGKAAKDVHIRLVDDHDIPVLTGDVGELIVRSDMPWSMNVGYWNRPEQTANAWRNGWFHTGDMFRCDEDGNFFFVDRKKDAVRRRGENISSFEVEREVTAYPDILEAACVSAPGDFGDDEVKVFLVPKEGRRIDPAGLIKFLIPRMPYFMVPRYIEIVPEFPKTPSMRVKKVELRERGNTANTWDRDAAGIIVKRDS